MVYIHPRMLEDSLCIEKTGRTTHKKWQQCLSLGSGSVLYIPAMRSFLQEAILLCAQKTQQVTRKRLRVRVCWCCGWWASSAPSLRPWRAGITSGPLGYTAHQRSTGKVLYPGPTRASNVTVSVGKTCAAPPSRPQWPAWGAGASGLTVMKKYQGWGTPNCPGKMASTYQVTRP